MLGSSITVFVSVLAGCLEVVVAGLFAGVDVAVAVGFDASIVVVDTTVFKLRSLSSLRVLDFKACEVEYTISLALADRLSRSCVAMLVAAHAQTGKSADINP